MLLSGAQLDVLERALMSVRVRSEDGVEVLEADLAEAKQNIARLPELESQNIELLSALNTVGTSVAMRWLVLAAIAAFAAGCLAGYKWLDRRVRRQFGGLKVY
jgi:hypothetical protein